MHEAMEEVPNHSVVGEVDEVPELSTAGEVTPPLTTAAEHAYKNLESKLILRDKLAIERTMLSKERTALSYMRTGMSMILGGLFFIGYFQHGTIFSYVGYATVVVAVIFTIFGFMQNQRSMKVINTVMGELNGTNGHSKETEDEAKTQ
jgi:uncharacterized membrane protein YidH (DUF202 family)